MKVSLLGHNIILIKQDVYCMLAFLNDSTMQKLGSRCRENKYGMLTLLLESKLISFTSIFLKKVALQQSLVFKRPSIDDKI